MKYLIILITSIAFASCQNEPKMQWSLDHTIQLETIAPNGIVIQDGQIILSNPAENSLDYIEPDGTLKKRIVAFNRPMHLSLNNDLIYVSDFLSDSILTWNNTSVGHIELPEEPDAPSGVSVLNESVAVADFYNNRIIYYQDGINKTFGTSGSEPGALTYPTDVQFAHDKIYVADAYNHRINIYDLEGAFESSFGAEEKMNAAVGIYVSDQHVFVCDYENSKVNIYLIDGQFQSSIDQDLAKPSDVFFDQGKLYVANFEGKSISVFSMK